MKILVAPDSFKGSLSASQVCDIVQRAIEEIDSSIRIDLLPLADGGEGTFAAISQTLNLIPEFVEVTGPMGLPVRAMLGISRDRELAVMEMASASGMPLVPVEDRNPLLATSYGTGQLLAHALNAGVSRIILGIGGSAVNDAGAGMLQALGFRLLDAAGRELAPGALDLQNLHGVDRSHAHPRLATVKLTIACDVVNPLLGETGATAVYGPQKGALPSMLPILEKSLTRFADCVEQLLKKNFRHQPGAGAAGGMGFTLMSILQADLGSGFDIIAETIGLRQRLVEERYDWILTGEGRVDAQSLQGKLLSRLGKLGLETGTPIVAFTGALADTAPALPGVDHIFPIVRSPCSLPEAMNLADTLLYEAVYRVMKLLLFVLKRP